MRTLVLHLQEKGEELKAAFVGFRGGRFLEGAEVSGEDPSFSGKNAVVLLDTPSFHFFRDRVLKGPQDVMALQIQEKVERTGIFRLPPAVFYRVGREEGNMVEVSVAAVDTGTMEARLEKLWRRGVRLRGVYSPPLAAASLAARSAPEKTLTLWIREGGFFLIGTAGGDIRSMRFVAFDEFIGPSESLVREETQFAQEQIQRLEGEGFWVVRSCGPLRHLFPEGNVPWPETLIPKPLQPIAFEHPEWFGALCVPSAFNMLPEPVQVWNRHMPWAMRAAVALLVLSLAQLGFWAYRHHRTELLEQDTQARMGVVAARADALQKAVPWDRLSVVEEYQRTWDAFQKEPRLDDWMVWLSRTAPENFRVVRFDVSKAGEKAPDVGAVTPARTSRRRGSEAGGKETSGGSTLVLELKGTVGFREAHRTFGAFLTALQERKNVRVGRFHYDEMTGEALFSFEIGLL